MAGAFALILAAFGSAVIGGATDGNTLQADKYTALTQSFVGVDAQDAATGSITSRDFNRELISKQTKEQTAQREIALKELAAKVDTEADRQKSSQWVLPVTGYRLTARFGQRSGLWANGHTGLDFAGSAGSTIVSVAAGVVKSAGFEGAYGNRTVITLTNGADAGTDIWYCHQSRIVVSPGDKVDPSTIIGYTGSTGNVTGPHLHLEVHPGGGGPVDPYPELIKHGVRP